ncbi:hypothetical protein [Nitrosomonas ureae]|uniref:Uncharacterized protein n=1 Tax=Nitrosomonas ureae TaxID=44577 RepID=A0A1H2DNW2_9PROT|nr:hypothetical protein [Nitrosomonas ureae]ALQ50791.1 hypothetical protein ATY38_05820 [Nitrosomonas ureae]SDT84421.1 hypothetical protein SAMN05216406_101257 [Nitrosomonas ureae]
MHPVILKFHRCVVALGLATLLPISAHADIFKWIRNEALPTIAGTRPVEIKPYISISSGSNQIRFGEDSAMIKIGPVTVQTGKLKLRLAQAGCIYATGGDVATCAPDVIDREARNLFEQVARGIESNSDLRTRNRPIATPSGGPLRVEDFNGNEIPWGPPNVSIGFDFSNPGSSSAANPSPSAFLHTFAIARGIDASNRATIEIVGRADFGFMDGQRGGILCLFADERGRYLRDRNGRYRDQYGIVALGSSTVVNQTPTLVSIQLSMPWSELELTDDIDPYSPKFVKCHITVDNTPMQETEWVPF